MTGPPPAPEPPPDEPPEDATSYEYPVDKFERESVGLPPLEEHGRTAVDPPREVRLSVLLWLAAAVALAAGFVLLIANVDDIAAANVASYERAVRAGDPIMRTDITAADVQAGASGLAWLLGTGGIMLAALVVIFAYRVREGTRSARSVLLALTALTAAFAVFMPAEYVNFAHWACVVLAAAALALLFLPQVSGYFPKLPVTRRRWRDRA
ncbi:MAG: hypothetical protein ACRDQB_08655 [Thermocrispum sp.]